MDTSDEKHLIYTFPRGPGEEIQAAIRKYKGRYFIDLRLWYMSKTENMLLPTKKGVAVSMDQLPELRKAVDRLSKASERFKPAEEVSV